MRDPNILSEDKKNNTQTDRACNDTCKDKVIWWERQDKVLVNETRLKLIKALPFKDKVGQENKQLFLQFFVNVIRVVRVTETVRSIVDLLNTINLKFNKKMSIITYWKTSLKIQLLIHFQLNSTSSDSMFH